MDLADKLKVRIYGLNIIIFSFQGGIMAGVPVSSFPANLHLNEMDLHFSENSVACADIRMI